MTVEAVKKKIKKKFGKYSSFAMIAGIDRYEFQRDFLEANRVEKKDIAKFNRLCDLLDPLSDPRLINQRALNQLKKSVEDAGGVTAFCEKAKFNIHSVRQILSGVRKRRTQMVDEVFAYFKIAI